MPIFEPKYEVGDKVWFLVSYVEETTTSDGFKHLETHTVPCECEITDISVSYSGPLPISYRVKHGFPHALRTRVLLSALPHEANFAEGDLYSSAEEALNAIEKAKH